MAALPVSNPSSTPSREGLLAQFGDEHLSINSLFCFCFIPGGRLSLLKDLTLEEDWGANNFVLLKYLAVHIRLAVEQARYVWNGDQIVMAAGSLTTRNGTPIFLGLVENASPEDNPWVLNWVGERPRCAELPQSANLGEWPELDASKEVLIACDLSNEERRASLPVIADLPIAAQLSALGGALNWSIRRGLGIRQIHGGGRGWFVPIHLESRQNLTLAPDLVAPVLVQDERLAVRAFMEPHVAYSPARAVVERWEQLPPWLLDAWEAASDGEESPDDHGQEAIHGEQDEDENLGD